MRPIGRTSESYGVKPTRCDMHLIVFKELRSLSAYLSVSQPPELDHQAFALDA